MAQGVCKILWLKRLLEELKKGLAIEMVMAKVLEGGGIYFYVFGGDR